MENTPEAKITKNGEIKLFHFNEVDAKMEVPMKLIEK